MLRPCVMLLLAASMATAAAQSRPCASVPPAEREFVRTIGACSDVAPIVDVAPKSGETAPTSVVTAVPNVVGLNFDAARERLAGYSLQRTYRASAEPGGTVLEQQPAPPARVAGGAMIRVVLSDGSLRPAPRVTATEVDGIHNAPAVGSAVRPQAAAVADDARAGRVEQGPMPPTMQARMPAGRVELAVPNVVGMTVKKAQARLSRFKVERSNRPSDAARGRVIEQIPAASARAAAGSAIVVVVSSGPARSASVSAAVKPAELLETPNVIGRSSSDATTALAAFKVERVEVVANAAASGQVLAQTPTPGTQVAPGSRIVLQVSDGSLANKVATPAATSAAMAPAATPSAATTPPAAATPTVAAPAVGTSASDVPTAAPMAPAVKAGQGERVPLTFPKGAVLVLVVGGVLGLVLGAMLMRRRVLSRRPAPIAPQATLPVAVFTAPPMSIEPVVVETTEIAFAAHLEPGETTIEFSAPPKTDETAPEHSRELHE